MPKPKHTRISSKVRSIYTKAHKHNSLKLTPDSLKHASFQKKGLLVFLLIFAGIGGYILISSKAAPVVSTSPNYRREPEDQQTALLRRNVDVETQTLSVLAKASKGHPQNPGKENAHMAAVSKQRLDDIKLLLSKDPQAVADLLLKDDVKQIASTIPGVKVEKPIELKGGYAMAHKDYFPNAKGNVAKSDEWHDMLNVPQKGSNKITQYELHSPDPMVFNKLSSDSWLDVSGIAFEDHVLVQSQKKISRQEAIDANNNLSFVHRAIHRAGSLLSPHAYAIKQTGTIRVAVIAVQCDGNPTPTFNMTNLRNNWTTNANNNIDDLYSKMSYGKVTIQPDFYGPYIMPQNSCFGLYDPNQLPAQANADINFASYDRLFFADDFDDPTGIANGGGGQATWGTAISTPDGPMNGGLAQTNGGWGLIMSSTAHELGHTFILFHSGSYNCQPDVFDSPTRLDSGCSSFQYGDTFDFMGQIDGGLLPENIAGELGAEQRSSLGWFNPANLVTLNTPGSYTYTLAPLESTNAATQAIRIPRGASGTSFWVDYRQPIDYDSWFTDTTKCPGCNHTAGPAIQIQDLDTSDDAKVIDNTPYSQVNNPDIRDGALLPGKTFRDPEYGISITTNSANSAGTSVTVTIPATATCVRNSPGVSVANPTQTVTPGQTVSFNVTVTNNDTASCSSDKFRTGDLGGNNYAEGYGDVGTYRTIATPNVFSLAPGASTTVKLDITQPMNEPDNATDYLPPFQVCGNYLEVACTNYSVTMTQSTPADTVAPSAPTNLTATAAGSTVVNLSWSAATDNNAVAGYTIYRNGAPISTVNGATTYYDRSLSASTTYSYQVLANDYKNNRSALSATSSATTPAKTDTTYPAINAQRFKVNNAHSVTVSWDPATDNVGIAFYWLYTGSGGNQVRLPPGTTSYTFDHLAANTLYHFYNNPCDGGGNCASSSPDDILYMPAEGTLPPSRPVISKHVLVAPSKGDAFWTASTDDKSVSGYNYFLNSRPVTTTPLSYPAIRIATGTDYSYSARDYVQAVDTDGNITQSAGGFIGPSAFGGTSSTDTTLPTAHINSPAGGSTVSGTGTVTVSASDNVGVSAVELYVDGTLVDGAENLTGINQSATPTFSTSLSWYSNLFSNGTHTLTAKAYDGLGNNIGTSSPVTVTVSNGAADSTPPTVSLTAPSSGATVSGSSVTVSASASDNVGVAGVQFKLDGTNLNPEDTSSPYSITWDSTTTINGSHVLSATARDAAGNSTTSSQVTITVSNSTAVPGDLNSDGHVTITDLSILLSNYSTSNPAADINHDGTVNILDLSILLSHYGV